MLLKPKLRTYMFNTEVYAYFHRSRRSFLAQPRIGILPLEIETGRYTPIYDKHTKFSPKRQIKNIVCVM